MTQFPLTLVYEAAFELLPPRMDSPAARAILTTIGRQESRFEHRIQLIGNHRRWWESLKGPARGMWQFERAGVRGVLQHPASRDHARQVLEALRYPAKVRVIHRALAHNDILACCIARLLLWTDPHALPTPAAPASESWAYYLRTWRPGKPKPETWTRFWQRTQEVTHA